MDKEVLLAEMGLELELVPELEAEAEPVPPLPRLLPATPLASAHNPSSALLLLLLQLPLLHCKQSTSLAGGF